jgi:predicted nucleotidyltransferase
VVERYIGLLADRGLEVRFGVLFGSQATGHAGAFSDIDLLVVSPLFDGRFRYSDTALLWHLAGEVDSRIEPIPCGEVQWREDDGNPIVEIARRQGIVVPPRTHASSRAQGAKADFSQT